jgi:diaminopimelate epimerase
MNGKQYLFSPVALYTPFLVHITIDWDSDHLYNISRQIQSTLEQGSLPQTVFLFIIDRENCMVRIWPHNNRHIDFIAACGAAGVAGVMNGLLEREAVFKMHNQEIFFQWIEESNSVFVTASSKYVFTGTYDFPEVTDSSSMIL